MTDCKLLSTTLSINAVCFSSSSRRRICKRGLIASRVSSGLSDRNKQERDVSAASGQQRFSPGRERKRREKRGIVHFLLCKQQAVMAVDICVKRALLVVMALNVVQLMVFWEFWSRGSPTDGRFSVRLKEPVVIQSVLKPWPTLSSFQPWSLNRNLKPYTCEAYFGHGFVEKNRILKSNCREAYKANTTLLRRPSDACMGSFKCYYSETLKTSVCEGKQMVMNLEKITMSRGGEAISEVIGRDEEEELPVFSEGAFQVQVFLEKPEKPQQSAPLFDEISADKLMPKGKIRTHTLRSLLLNLQTVDSRSVVCNHRVREPTVIVTRFEYANLFHTSTDWFSAYISSRVVGLQERPRLVLLDGHCESPMDDGWKAMFTSVSYAKHLTGPVCFDHAIFAPLGYDVPLFKHLESTLNCQGCSVEALDSPKVKDGTGRKTARVREFGEFFAKSFESRNVPTKGTAKVDTHVQEVNVLFVRREDYLAHPRHSGKPESRLSNEREVFEALENWAVEKSEAPLIVTIVNGLLAHMNLDEQIKAVKKADVLAGAHGAGLTHLLFANPSTTVFELLSPMYRRPHFATFSYWMGMDYRVINMDSSSANIDQVIGEMNGILEDVKGRKYA